mmetsp:Transcript_20410/g.70091  ORF Transcript_20410/g.70091 Transcript_20410/m.70091 type:complete len:237 (+) Transcript_20410:371-1081(+)
MVANSLETMQAARSEGSSLRLSGGARMMMTGAATGVARGAAPFTAAALFAASAASQASWHPMLHRSCTTRKTARALDTHGSAQKKKRHRLSRELRIGLIQHGANCHATASRPNHVGINLKNGFKNAYNARTHSLTHDATPKRPNATTPASKTTNQSPSARARGDCSIEPNAAAVKSIAWPEGQSARLVSALQERAAVVRNAQAAVITAPRRPNSSKYLCASIVSPQVTTASAPHVG